jgi:hypothetical protein
MPEATNETAPLALKQIDTQAMSQRKRRSIHLESTTGRIRRGEPGAAPQDLRNPKSAALKARFSSGSRDFVLAKSGSLSDLLQPRRQFREHCRRAVLRFKRRIGRWCCVLGSLTQRSPPGRRSPDFANPIGHRSTVFFVTAAFHLLTHRIWSKVSSPICLSKTR